MMCQPSQMSITFKQAPHQQPDSSHKMPKAIYRFIHAGESPSMKPLQLALASHRPQERKTGHAS